MAFLGATSLTGCSKIPSFIAAGSKMIFNMATVPVSWTKDTTPNQSMCRITNSTLSPGGSLTFSQVFQSSKALSGSTVQQSLGFSVNSVPVSFSTGSANALSSTSVQPATVTVSQIDGHDHNIFASSIAGIKNPFSRTGITVGPQNNAPPSNTPRTTPNSGGSGAHNHTNPQGPHSHSSSVSHTHPTISSQHNHTISGGSEDFNILYVDIVVATKD